MAPNVNARKLVLHAKDLGKSTYLMLTFNVSRPATATAAVPKESTLCWKVIPFAASGIHTVPVQYTAETAFFVPEVITGHVIVSINAQLCSTGQKCSVVTQEGTNVVTAPEKGEENKIECYNKTADNAAIGIGFYSEKAQAVEPALLWQNVPIDGNVQGELTLNLKIYETRDYQENEIIQGKIKSEPLWSHELDTLSETTHYDVAIAAGKATIKPRA